MNIIMNIYTYIYISCVILAGIKIEHKTYLKRIKVNEGNTEAAQLT